MAYSRSSSSSSSRNNKKRRSHNSMNNEHLLFTKQENGISIIQQYQTWCKTLKIELKSKSQYNVDVRLEKIEQIVCNIVNTEFSSNSYTEFSISDDDKFEMKRQIEDKIDLWKGVEIEVCKNKEKKNFEAYQATARNWFNRNKAKIYGNHLFYDIIFIHILKYCAELENISDEKKMVLFIDIFERILNEPIQFPRTKLQPLLPHQALMQPNRFKKACEQFTTIYNIRWILASASSNNTKRDRDRAKKIHNSFTTCLATIKQQLQTSNSNLPPIPYPFDEFMNDNPARNNNSNNDNHSEPQLMSTHSGSTFKSISTDYEINDASSPSPNSSNVADDKSAVCGRLKQEKLSMIDVPSNSTETTLDQYLENDDFEFMTDLPPTIGETGDFKPFSNHTNHVNNLQDIDDEVVYDVNAVNHNNNNRRNLNNKNNENLFDYTSTPHRCEYDQKNDVNVINTNNSNNDTHRYQPQAPPMINSNNSNPNPVNQSIHGQNNSNYINHPFNNFNCNNHCSFDDRLDHIHRNHDNLSSVHTNSTMDIPSNTPYTPPYSNHTNLMQLPVIEQSFQPFTHQNSNNNHPQYHPNFDVNENQHQHQQQHQQQPMIQPPITPPVLQTNHSGHFLPETSLNGQRSNSSEYSLPSLSYAPCRGTNQSLNVSRNRYSPISTPTTPNQRPYDHGMTIHHNHSYNNNNNRRIVDSYPFRPFSPCTNNSNNIPFSYRQQQHYNMPPPQQRQEPTEMSYDGTTRPLDNDNDFIFTNLSNISSPTPFLGGFL